MPQAYVLDYALLGAYSAVWVAFNVGFLVRVVRLRQRVRQVFDQRQGRLPSALRGYKPAEVVRAKPAGRSLLDVRALLHSRLPESGCDDADPDKQVTADARSLYPEVLEGACPGCD